MGAKLDSPKFNYNTVNELLFTLTLIQDLQMLKWILLLLLILTKHM